MNILNYFDLPRLKEAIGQIADKEHIRVLFVCLGNICRSPAAEGLMLREVSEHHDSARWEIDSAGTGGYHIGQLPDPRMRAHARRRGLELTHRCRQVSERDFDSFDLIIGMDDANVDRLRHLAPTIEDERKVIPMAMLLSDMRHFDHIPDPYYDGAEGFERVLDLLTEATRNLYDTVSAAIG
ncbi:MAG: low molecular weight phosphotyrosine protein phosphatase [Muribaculaceae bacterium]|nr:low molecular weight phosphotyrosine protein phosphatase [Muribaculaceae bacterium]